MLKFLILPSGNIHNGIPESKTYQHQRHTSRNTENRHKETFFISEKVSQSRFPCKIQMLPEKRDPFQQDSLTLFGSRRTHQRCRGFRQCPVTGENGGSDSTHSCRTCCYHCKFKLITDLDIVHHALVHNAIPVNNNQRQDLLSDQYSQNTASHCGKKGIQQIFGCNCILAVSQSLHCTNLGSLFFHHSCHGSQTYQCSHQEKDNRENLSDASHSVCIIPII